MCVHHDIHVTRSLLPLSDFLLISFPRRRYTFLCVSELSEDLRVAPI